MSYIRQTPRYRSRSFVQGFLKLHFLALENGNTSISITDVDGAGQNVSGASSASPGYLLRATSPGRGGCNFYNGQSNSASSEAADSTELGIVIGTGTTAVAPTDFGLATLVADGITSGTMEYFPSSGSGLTISAPTGSFTLERLFRNSSGATITINEVGVFAGMYASTAGIQGMHGFCVIRDIVSPGFSVLNGEYARVIYTISVTA